MKSLLGRFSACVLGFRVEGLGFRVVDMGLRVSSLRALVVSSFFRGSALRKRKHSGASECPHMEKLSCPGLRSSLTAWRAFLKSAFGCYMVLKGFIWGCVKLEVRF